MSDVDEENNDGWTVSASLVEVVVSGILLLLGIIVALDSYRTGAGWTGGQLQSGYFPFRLGIIVAAISAVIFVTSIARYSKSADRFINRTEFGRVMMVLVPTALYVLGIEIIGIYVASAIFIAFFMLVTGKQGWLKTLAISLGTSVTFFILFEVIFLIPLPKGPLEMMLGY